jgi:Putative restriction endonuclease
MNGSDCIVAAVSTSLSPPPGEGRLAAMQTVVLGPRPAELDALIERRRALGIDLYDEVWKGSYHISPAGHPSHGYLNDQLAVALRTYAVAAALVGTGPFNLGSADDYRVPDRGFHRVLPSQVWVPTAAIVVEIVSPDDETYEKFEFYFERGVDEMIIADPAARTVTFWSRNDKAFVESPTSRLLALDVVQLTNLITWP